MMIKGDLSQLLGQNTQAMNMQRVKDSKSSYSLFPYFIFEVYMQNISLSSPSN